MSCGFNHSAQINIEAALGSIQNNVECSAVGFEDDQKLTRAVV